MTRLADRYTIVRALGRGRTGVVLEAHDDELDQRIAIKVIDREHLADPRTSERLRRELAAAHRVTHPNVCRVFDADVGAGLCTMELLAGETLEQRLTRGVLPPALASSIVAQLERALVAIHAAGAAHGEIGPHNVMLCGERAVIVGLGNATTATAASDLAALDTIARTLHVARPRGTRRASIVAIALMLVVIVAGGAFVLHRASRGAPPSGRMIERRSGVVARWLELDGAGKEMIDGAARDTGGNVYVAGHISTGSRLAGQALAHPGGGSLAGVVAAYDREGRPRWRRVVFSVSNVAAATIAADDDLVVVAGRFEDGVIDLGRGEQLVADGTDAYVIALSASDGAIRWGRTIAATSSAMVKVSGIGPDGSIYVSGEYHGTLSLGGAGPRHGDGPSHFFASYDRDGDLRWATTTSGSGTARTYALAFHDGAVVIAGEATGPVVLGETRWGHDGRTGFVAAFEQTSGQPRWVRPVLGKDSTTRGITTSGSLVVMGERLPDDKQAVGWIAELDAATGGVRWERPFGRGFGLQLRALVRLTDGRLAIAGELVGRAEIAGQSFDGVGPADLFVAILPLDNSPPRATVLSGPGRERIKAALALPDGGLAVYGHHQGVTIDGFSMRGDGFTDGFFAELRVDQLFDQLLAPASASGSR